MTTTNTNHFSQLVNKLQGIPQNQRTEACITGIVTVMRNSNQADSVQELAQELAQIGPQLVSAIQQGQAGGGSGSQR